MTEYERVQKLDLAPAGYERLARDGWGKTAPGRATHYWQQGLGQRWHALCGKVYTYQPPWRIIGRRCSPCLQQHQLMERSKPHD